ncbi:PREDICTED: protein RMD5 homolog A-like [Camelina sativa]|uniref:Protein RMD5 homolog A-like n=1 Tax=Camelina sativa TaxID=90675 RepID=A0ABM0T9M9_CAMSA|nr:PREDICTED: protein RMD5 homolog A-like [Camelina sativa]
MDQTTAVMKDALDRVTKKQKLHHSVSLDVIDLVCDTIQDTLSRIQLGNNDGVEPESVLAELRQKLDALLPTIQLKRSQKETKLGLDKLVKTFESFYHRDISLACRNIGFDIRLVNKILIQHCYREGLFEVGDCLVKEAGEEEETEVRSQSVEIKQIIESMKLRNIEPAMRWVSANRGKLKEKSSEMEFKLVSLKYCNMLREGNRDDAMKYARTHLTRYCSGHLREIQKLVTCQIWIGKLDKCPYAEMVSPSCWDKITKELIREYYHLLDQPSRSPLTVALSAGLESLPTLLKLVDVMAPLKKEEWEEMKQVPVPLELGNELQFHSVFVCPVSRDESCSKENPPMMMMPCRHVISMQSVIRLSKNCASRRFKCPYCSAQTSSPACRQLFF